MLIMIWFSRCCIYVLNIFKCFNAFFYVCIYIYLSMGLVDANYFIMVELIAVVKV